jgi:hypothetical protein
MQLELDNLHLGRSKTYFRPVSITLDKIKWPGIKRRNQLKNKRKEKQNKSTELWRLMAVVNIRDSFVDVPMFSYLLFFKRVPPAGRGIARSNHLFISFSLFLYSSFGLVVVVVVAGLFHFPNER